MHYKRVIPCMDVDNGRVVKGTKFIDIRDAGDPVELAAHYDAQGADELIFLDITATSRQAGDRGGAGATGRGRRVRAVHDRRRRARGRRTRTRCSTRARTRSAINSAALARPELIDELAQVFGAQCVVLAIDAKRRPDGSYEAYVAGGRTPTGKDAVEWAREGVERGAGEILLTSMDRDGTKDGYELTLTRPDRGRRRRAGDRLRRRRAPAAPDRGPAGRRGRRPVPPRSSTTGRHTIPEVKRPSRQRASRCGLFPRRA